MTPQYELMIHQHQQYDLLNKVVLERVIFTPPLRLKENLTSESCLLYSVKGKSTLYDSGQKHILTPDSGVLMKCGNYFNHWQVNKDNSKNEAIAIHLYPDLIRYVYKDKVPEYLLYKKTANDVSIQYVKEDTLLKPYIQSLQLYFNNPEIVDDEVVILKVKELLSLLYKINSSNIRDMLHGMFTPHDFDIKSIIDKNLYEDISLEEMAHLCSLSLSSFKRKFKAIFNDTPGSYIKNKRLEKAAELLRISNDRVTDICFDSGFSNVESFSKSFKQKFGTTPSAYRKGV